MAAWYVEPEHRKHSLTLMVRVTAQAGYHFTNFTPHPAVARILTHAGFQLLPAEVTAAPNLPLGRWRRSEIHDRLDAIESVLNEDRRKVARDHADCPGLLQLAAGVRDEGYCHVVYRRGTCRGLPSAVIHDISDHHLFTRFWPNIAAYFLRRGLAATRIRTLSLGGSRLPLSVALADRHRLFCRSATLGPESIRTLYSELMVFGEDGK
jgi:hypothetical protein